MPELRCPRALSASSLLLPVQTLIPELHDKSDRTPGTRDFEREERYEECMQVRYAGRGSHSPGRSGLRPISRLT